MMAKLCNFACCAVSMTTSSSPLKTKIFHSDDMIDIKLPKSIACRDGAYLHSRVTMN